MAFLTPPPQGGYTTGYNPATSSDGSGYTGLAYPGSATYTPDYQSLIQQDPAFLALQQQLSAQGIQDASQRQAATEQALIQFGMVPDFSSVAAQLGLSPQALQMLQADIDPNAAALAQQNTSAGLSTEAQLQHSEDLAMMGLRNSLAARGALSSGDDAFRTNEQQQNYSIAQNNALQSLLGQIGGYQSQFLGQQNQENSQLNQGLQQAEGFEAGLPQNQPFSLTYNARTGKYMDPTGNAYTPTQTGSGWTITGDGTGLTYTLNPDGSIKPVAGTTTPTPPPLAPAPAPAPSPTPAPTPTPGSPSFKAF